MNPSRHMMRLVACRLLPRRQNGQSTTEFAVLSLVLVPLFIIVPLIGSYLDLAHFTELASRYVAFEATIRNTASSWKSDAELATEVRRRFFSASDAPIKTDDAAGDFAAHRNPLWTDHKGNPLLAKFADDVSVRTTAQSKNAPAAALYAGGSGFKLPKENFYTATVTVKPRKIEGLQVFDKLELSMTRSTTILVDGWTAASPDVVKAKIQGAGFTAYPIHLLKPFEPIINVVAPTILDPRIDIDNVKPEVVPCDRLKPAC